MRNKILTAALGFFIALVPATSGADASVLFPDTRDAVVVDFTTGVPRVSGANMYSAKIHRAALEPSDQALTYIDPNESVKLTRAIQPKTAVVAATGNRWAYTQIRSDEANAMGYDGTGIKVGFLDTGVDPTAPSLVAQNRLVALKDFVDNIPGYVVHGTLTTGVVGSVVDAESGAGGVARGASIYMARVCGPYPVNCPIRAIDEGFAWALQQGVDVISMSLGGQTMGSSGIAAMMSWATTHNISVVVAAGNDGCTAESSGGVLQNPWNNNCRNRSNDSYPARFPIAGLIEVGALDRNMTRAFFSSWGPNLDIMAPGVDVMTSGPVDFEFSAGTSLATPMVAGVVALIKQAAPSLNPQQIQAVIEASAQPVNETKPNVWNSCTWNSSTQQWSCDYSFASTLPQAYFTGAGCIDAVAAIKMARAVAASSLLAAPNTTTLTSGVSTASAQISWAAVTGATSYLVLQNQRIIGSTPAGTTSLILNNLFGGSSSAIQIQVVGGTSNGSRTAPALLQTSPDEVLAAPEITRHHASENAIDVTLATPYLGDPAGWYLYGVALTSDGQGLSCQMPNNRVDLSCDGLTPKPGLTAQIAMIAPNGTLGALSEPFALEYNDITNVQFESVVDNHDQSLTLNFAYAGDHSDGFQFIASPRVSSWTWTDQTSVTVTDFNYGWPIFVGVCLSTSNHEGATKCSKIRTVMVFPPDLGQATITSQSSATSKSVTFNVNLPTGTQGYNVYRSDGKAFSSSGPAFTDNESTSFAGRSFKYRVWPWRYFNGGNSAGQFGVPSAWFTGTFAGRAPRPTPSRTTATPAPTKIRAPLPALPNTLQVGSQVTINTQNSAGAIASVVMSLTSGSSSCQLRSVKTGNYVTSYTLKATTYSSAGCTISITATVSSRNANYQSSSATGLVTLTR